MEERCKVKSDPRCKVVGTLEGGKYENLHDSNKRVYSTEYCSPTVTTCAGGNQEVKIAEPTENTLTTSCNQGVMNNYRIRKLTPKECFRLMGVHDDDFDKIAKNQSNSSLYHLAGDSIIVDVLMHIFGEMM